MDLAQIEPLLPLPFSDRIRLRQVCRFFREKYPLPDILIQKLREKHPFISREDFYQRTLIRAPLHKFSFGCGRLIREEMTVFVTNYFEETHPDCDPRTLSDFESHYDNEIQNLKKLYRKGDLIYSEELVFDESYECEDYPIYRCRIQVNRSSKYLEPRFYSPGSQINFHFH